MWGDVRSGLELLDTSLTPSSLTAWPPWARCEGREWSRLEMGVPVQLWESAVSVWMWPGALVSDKRNCPSKYDRRGQLLWFCRASWGRS